MYEISDYEILVHRIDLTTARNYNSELATGLKNTLLVRSIDDINANLCIKFDSPASGEISLKVGDTYNFKDISTSGEGPYFQKVFFSNDAVAQGEAILVFARNVEIHRLLRITADLIQEGVLQQIVPLAGRINLEIFNPGPTTVYIGSATVTIAGATQGVPVPANNYHTFTIGEGAILYGIAAIAQNINILEGA
jgi:hypothetical protein